MKQIVGFPIHRSLCPLYRVGHHVKELDQGSSEVDLERLVDNAQEHHQVVNNLTEMLNQKMIVMARHWPRDSPFAIKPHVLDRGLFLVQELEYETEAEQEQGQ